MRDISEEQLIFAERSYFIFWAIYTLQLKTSIVKRPEIPAKYIHFHDIDYIFY